ncbi:MAG: hypothetical protein ABIP63_07845 [Thermoanaerobaculia bacterium]
MDYEFIVDSGDAERSAVVPARATTGWETVVFELEDEAGPADAGP